VDINMPESVLPTNYQNVVSMDVANEDCNSDY
jgi:hypothetical protein